MRFIDLYNRAKVDTITISTETSIAHFDINDCGSLKEYYDMSVIDFRPFTSQKGIGLLIRLA